MNKLQAISNTLKLAVKRLLAFLPTKLPVGMTDMHKFYDEIIELSGPFATVDSMKFTLSGVIMRLDQSTDRISKRYLAKVLRRMAASQLASAILTDIKLAQQAAYEAEQKALKLQQEAIAEAAKLQQEATITTGTPASGETTPVPKA